MGAFEITAPVNAYTGQVAGVAFRGGVGHVTDETKGGRAALEYFRRRGYRVAPAADPEVAVDNPADPPIPEPETEFDPGRHSVDEVLSYLNGADLDEAVRVLDAEAEGKDRVTVTKHREDVIAAKTDPSAVEAGDDTEGAQE